MDFIQIAWVVACPFNNMLGIYLYVPVCPPQTLMFFCNYWKYKPRSPWGSTLQGWSFHDDLRNDYREHRTLKEPDRSSYVIVNTGNATSHIHDGMIYPVVMTWSSSVDIPISLENHLAEPITDLARTNTRAIEVVGMWPLIGQDLRL